MNITKNQENYATTTSFETVQAGEKLFVTLLQVRPVSVFDTDVRYEYEVDLDNTSVLPSRNGNELGYGFCKRPSFVIADKGDRIFHGSCRKLHGIGKDATEKLSELIENADAPRNRPTALFLTGDQVYADDVHPKILTKLQEFEKEYIGTELVPDVGDVSELNDRKSVLKQYAGFTSGKASCHLITLGEFIAMYHFAWSPWVWNSKLVENKEPPFLNTSIYFQKITANVPTYMICDDHEVTDDWYLDSEWKTSQLGKPLGRRIIVNALIAYWLFQAWGNNPDDYDYKFLKSIEDLIKDRKNDVFLINKNWSYVSPTNPKAIVVDIRTRRTGANKNLEIVDKSGMDVLDKLIATANSQKSAPLILVSPTPVFGMSSLEVLQSAATAICRAPIKFDHERWFQQAFKGVLEKLLEHEVKEIVILSGDVHYSMNILGEIATAKGNLSVYQLVSSGIKNSCGPLSRVGLKLLAVLQIIRDFLARKNDQGLRTKEVGSLKFSWRLILMGGFRRGSNKFLLLKNNIGCISITSDSVRHELFVLDQAKPFTAEFVRNSH